MKSIYKGLALLLAVAFPTTTAQALCSEPHLYESPPDAPMAFSKPSAPLCLAGYRFSRQHTCSERDIKDYVDDLKDYSDRLFKYADKAAAFANLAAKFARQAEEYARCESRDAKGDLQ